jgi:hypothetical protein
MSCLICLEGGTLLSNTGWCSCKYQIHQGCWLEYLKTSEKCPLCRKDLTNPQTFVLQVAPVLPQRQSQQRQPERPANQQSLLPTSNPPDPCRQSKAGRLVMAILLAVVCIVIMYFVINLFG